MLIVLLFSLVITVVNLVKSKQSVAINSARAKQLLSKKCRNGGEPLAALCPIWPVRDLNIRPVWVKALNKKNIMKIKYFILIFYCYKFEDFNW